VERELYFISMAAEMLGMHPQTLRKYERLGLIQPSRTIGSMRLYSREELERLRLIKHQPRGRAASADDRRGDAADPPAHG
jgi:predicted site-specific integrase-resolvase